MTRNVPLISALPGAVGLDRGEVKDHVGVVGQLLQHRSAERRANEVDAGIQVFMRVRCDTADRVSGSEELPGDGTSSHSGDLGEQDPHARPPPTVSS